MCHRVLHKESDPASVLDFPALVCRIGRMSAAHRQQMFHRDLLEVFGRILRTVFREDVHKFLVQCQPAFGDGKTDCHRCKCLADRVEDVRDIFFAFAHPLFIYYISILEDHNAVQVLTGLFHCCKIFFCRFSHLDRCLTTWKRLGEGIDVYEIYSSFPDRLLDLRTFQEIRNSLTVSRYILVAHVHYGLHLGIVVCRMVHEHISLAFLKLVQHLDEGGNLFFSSTFRTFIADIFKVILLECIETVHGREIIFFGQFLYEGIDFRTVAC